MVKDFFEDSRRRQADKQENNRVTTLIEPQNGHKSLSSGLTESLIEKPIVSDILWH